VHLVSVQSQVPYVQAGEPSSHLYTASYYIITTPSNNINVTFQVQRLEIRNDCLLSISYV